MPLLVPGIPLTRALMPAATAVILVAALLGPARAQSLYTPVPGTNPDVTVDTSVLDALGPAPTVPGMVLTPPAAAARLQLHLPSHRRAEKHRRIAPHRRLAARRHKRATHRTTAATRARAPRVATAPVHLPTPEAAAPKAVVKASAAPAVAVKRMDGAASAMASAPPMPASPAPPPAPAVAAAAPPAARPAAVAIPVAAPANLPGPVSVIRFAPGAAAIPATARPLLDAVAARLQANDTLRLQLVAFASGSGDDSIDARRISLARAVAVRAYLIEKGVRSFRMDVRALGNRVEGNGPADRVDLIVLDH